MQNSLPDKLSPFIVVIILNTNRRYDTLECLKSVTSNNYPSYRVIVLDNASTDGSVEAIQNEFSNVQIVKLEKNLGYTGNNNVGFQKALEQGADWVLVLNEDTTMAPDCIDLLVKAGERDEKIGIVGPMVYHYDEPEVIQSAGAEMDRLWKSRHRGMNEDDQGQFSQSREVDWVSGCALLIRRKVLEHLGRFDERFFYYNEEVDLCFRARRSGWKVLFDPEAKLWHKGVQRKYSPSPSVTYYDTRNYLLFLEKNDAPIRVKFFTWVDYLKRLVSWSIRPRWRSKRLHRDAMWHGMVDYINRRWGKAH